MKKIVILIISIVLVIVMMAAYELYCYRQTLAEADKVNKTYESFYNVEVLGTDVASLINKIDDSNSQNGVEKDTSGLYIENDSNSIMLDVKFSELDKAISLEKIEEQGINQFVQNFGAISFKCTKIEYHEKTHKVKYIYFEQI